MSRYLVARRLVASALVAMLEMKSLFSFRVDTAVHVRVSHNCRRWVGQRRWV